MPRDREPSKDRLSKDGSSKMSMLAGSFLMTAKLSGKEHVRDVDVIQS
ncbi:MAG: hypothetical protein ABIP82_03230 [Nitrospirales bacterium]